MSRTILTTKRAPTQRATEALVEVQAQDHFQAMAQQSFHRIDVVLQTWSGRGAGSAVGAVAPMCGGARWLNPVRVTMVDGTCKDPWGCTSSRMLMVWREVIPMVSIVTNDYNKQC